MRAYSIFDDFDNDAVSLIEAAGIELTVHPLGKPRPTPEQMKKILEIYDCVFIGTSQKITEEMFENINEPRVIATASVGMDHIKIPKEKRKLVTVYNTPTANAQSVAEYTIGCALACCKRLYEGKKLYLEGKNNKFLSQKPEDLAGKTIGVIGAGNISERIMAFAAFLQMKVICWTSHPTRHEGLLEEGVSFVSLEQLAEQSDVISVNLPNVSGTKKIISEKLIKRMKNNAIFISVSRLDTIDIDALIAKARDYKDFYVCMDIDVDNDVVRQIQVLKNVQITPHIAGGTIETRRRMFLETARQVVNYKKIC